MKKYFSIGVLIALAALTLGSCVKNIEEEVAVEEQSTIRTVSFSAALADQTKTGLSIKFVPNWIKTKTSNVHLFETNGNTILEGVDLEMRVPSDRNNEVAYFKADFSEEMSIIVNPPSTTSALTRAASDYVYTGIVAQAKTVGNTKKYFIPAEQLPDAVSLIDPDADFLIGNAVDTYSSSQALKEMDMFFKRPVAVSRLAIMNVEGTKITSVKITSLDKLTGETTYDAINFPNGTATFDNAGSNTITMTYGEGAEIDDGSTFYAYFISLTGTKRISEVEVTTDQYVYTKSYAGGKSMKFDNVQFKNIAVDMSKVTPTPVGPVTPSQTLSFRKNGQTITSDIYDLHSSAPYSTPTISGLVNGSTVDWSSSDNTVATVSGGVVTPIATGQTTITAVASATGYQDTEISYTLTVSDTTPLSQTLEFTPSSVTVVLGDSYTTPTLSGAKTTVTYASDNTAVATVDQTTGALSIVGAGTATITATAAAGTGTDGNSYASASAEYTVEVSEPAPVAQTLSFNPTTLTVVQGDNTFTTPTLSGDYHTEVTYTSSEPTVVAVDAQSGALTIITAGEATITATAPAGTVDGVNYSAASASYDVTVVPPVAPSGQPYTQITSVSQLVDGESYLIVSARASASNDTPSDEFANKYIFKGVDDGSVVEVEPAAANGVITGDNYSDYEFVLTKKDNNNTYSFSGKNGYLYWRSSGNDRYIGISESEDASNLRLYPDHTKPTGYEAAFFFGAVNGSSTEYLYLNKDQKFKIGKTGSDCGIFLYMKVDEREAQNLVFSAASAEYDLGTSTWTVAKPTLDGAHTTVTYSSSDPTVASVDNSGNVTPIKKGTVTITANAEGNTQYKPGKASYTLNVVNSNVPTYYKAEEMEAGKEYLIVSNGYALLNSGSSTPGAAAVTVANDVIQYDAPATALWTASANNELTNDGKYLRRSNSNLQIGNASQTASNNQWTYDAEHNYVMVGAYYLYYSTSNSRFSISNSQSDTHVAALYTTTPPLPAWEISYNVQSATYDKYAGNWTTTQPSLTTNAAVVTYESSDPTVATVSGAGAITALTTGTTTITATAVADATHKKAVASYTLTVVNSDPNLPRYTKVTSTSDLTVGAKYLMVFEGLEGDTDGNGDPKVFNPVLNSETQFAKATSSAVDVAIASNTITSDAFGDCQFTLEAGYYLKSDKVSKYIYPGSTTTSSGWSSSTTYYMYAESSPTNALSIAFSDGIAAITIGSNCLVWSTSSHYFSVNSQPSTSYSTGICLYKLEGSGGTTPDDPEPPTPTTPTYTRISGAAELVTGTYIIVEKTDTYVYNASGTNHGGYGTIGTTSGISKSGTTITLSDAIASSYEFTFTRTGDNLTIQPVAGEFAGKYMYATNDVGSTYINFQTEANNFTINAQAGDYVYFRTTKGTSSNEYLYKKSSDSFFKLGGSGAPSTSNADAGIYLYKKN